METYVSTDVETDGPIPGRNSMLSLGSAAFDGAGNLLGTFSVNLHQLPDATPNESTMKWWGENREAWAAHRVDPEYPGPAMHAYCAWLEALPGKKVFVGYPAGFDFTFVYWYLMAFAGKSPFGFQALDMKTYAMARLGCGFKDSVKGQWPKKWFPVGKKHSHIAVEDAIEQGHIFIAMLRERRMQE